MDSFKKNVALKYDFKSKEAPKVIAKGFRKNAELIEQIATENEIPIKKDEPLANMLSQLPVLAQIPDELYEVVATIYVELLKQDE